jgi:hypothetical protein
LKIAQRLSYLHWQVRNIFTTSTFPASLLVYLLSV